jgi:hypothetical protein
MLLEHGDVDASARQQEAQHESARPAANDAATGGQLLGCHYRSFMGRANASARIAGANKIFRDIAAPPTDQRRQWSMNARCRHWPAGGRAPDASAPRHGRKPPGHAAGIVWRRAKRFAAITTRSER